MALPLPLRNKVPWSGMWEWQEEAFLHEECLCEDQWKLLESNLKLAKVLATDSAVLVQDLAEAVTDDADADWANVDADDGDNIL